VHPGLADQQRFYELAAAACRRRPALHAAQLAALDAHLALVRRAPDLARFAAALAHGGHAHELTRAGQIDRFAADLARARALGDTGAAQGAAQALRALAPAGDLAFPIAIGGTISAVGRAARAALAGDQVVKLVEAAIDFACDHDPARRGDAYRRAVHALITARAVEPGLGLARIMAPPHRHRLPFGPGAASVLRELLVALIGDDPALDGAPPEEPPEAPPPHLPGALEQLRFDGWPPTDVDAVALAARVRAMAAGEEAGAARSAAIAAVNAERSIAIAQDEPALVAIADRALADLATAQTPTEIQALLSLHHEIARVERSWWHLLVHAALWPAVAAIASPASARTAAVLAARLFGAGPLDALQMPVVLRAIDRQLVGNAQSQDPTRAIAGPGSAHVGTIRRLLATNAVTRIEHAARAGEPVPDFATAFHRWPDRDAFLADATAALDAAGAPRGGDGAVVLWGERVPLAAVDATLADVPRPRPEAL
jgi:hypothetical protein